MFTKYLQRKTDYFLVEFVDNCVVVRCWKHILQNNANLEWAYDFTQIYKRLEIDTTNIILTSLCNMLIKFMFDIKPSICWWIQLLNYTWCIFNDVFSQLFQFKYTTLVSILFVYILIHNAFSSLLHQLIAYYYLFTEVYRIYSLFVFIHSLLDYLVVRNQFILCLLFITFIY